jgi:hypothetical protein
VGLTIIVSVASAGIGGIVTQLGRLAFRGRRLWAQERKQAAASCGSCRQSGRGCDGGACVEWM